MKFRCKFAGKRLEDILGNPMACQGCGGVLIRSGKQLRHENPIRIMLTLPRRGIELKPEYRNLVLNTIGEETFSCPATVVAFINNELTDEVKKIVEVIK